MCRDDFINIEEEEEIDQAKTGETGEKKNQAGGETAHSQLVLFKLRILSLLEIFLHENPGKYTLLISFIWS